MPIRGELFAPGETPRISCEKTYHKDDMARKRLHLPPSGASGSQKMKPPNEQSHSAQMGWLILKPLLVKPACCGTSLLKKIHLRHIHQWQPIPSLAWFMGGILDGDAKDRRFAAPVMKRLVDKPAQAPSR